MWSLSHSPHSLWTEPNAYIWIWVNVLSSVTVNSLRMCWCGFETSPNIYHLDTNGCMNHWMAWIKWYEYVCCVHYTHLRSSDPIDSIFKWFYFIIAEWVRNILNDNSGKSISANITIASASSLVISIWGKKTHSIDTRILKAFNREQQQQKA